LNQWAHEKINADAYLLLQITSPYREKKEILNWLRICVRNKIQSAFAVIPKGNLTFKRSGSFFYYTKEQLAT
ncbi:unnamed protein product, partial [marine sediment metagenome]